MLQGPSNTQAMNLSRFIELIKTLEFGNLISLGYFSEKRLPQKVSLAFAQFDLALNDKNSNTFPNPSKECRNFIVELFRAAKNNNYPERANSTTANAEYLLGLLIHHQISIELLDKDNQPYVESITSLMLRQSPLHEIEYFTHGHAHYELHQKLMPKQGVKFMDEHWRAAQQYPDKSAIDVFYMGFLQALALKNKEEQIAQKIVNQKKIIAFAKKYSHLLPSTQPQVPNSVSTVCFGSQTVQNNCVINFEKLSYIIEIFFKAKQIQPQSLGFNGAHPMIRNELAVEIDQFITLARQRSFSFWSNPSLAFERMLKMLMVAASHDPVPQLRSTAQLLMGFFVYQNFQIAYNNKIFSMRNAIDTILTGSDKERIKQHEHLFPFLFDQKWLEAQAYPNHAQLEWAYQQFNTHMNTETSQRFLGTQPRF